MDKEFTCSKCKQKVTGTEYYEGGYGMVEQYYKCSCGYCWHWAYGDITPECSDFDTKNAQ